MRTTIYDQIDKTDQAESIAQAAVSRRKATMASHSAMACLSAPGLVSGGKKSQKAVTPTNDSVNGVAMARGDRDHPSCAAHYPSAIAHAPCNVNNVDASPVGHSSVR